MAEVTFACLYCLDDHRIFSEDVKKRFSDASRYLVGVYHKSEDILNELKRMKRQKVCKVAILALHDSKDNLEMIKHISIQIRKIDQSTGIIILSPPDSIDDTKKSIRFNIDSYIRRNANTILRIHNTVKKLISKHDLLIFRKRRNWSFCILVTFFFLSLLISVISCLRLPMFF